jgi:DNA polymerase theta
LLEVLLSKLLFAARDSVQIVGMSATLPNVADLAKWVHGSLYCTLYRPVELVQLVCMDRALYRVEAAPHAGPGSMQVGALHVSFQLLEALDPVSAAESDPDGFLALCVRSVQRRESVLLFCPSKDRCERCCELLVKAIRALSPSSVSEEAADASARREALDELSQTPVGVCQKLLESVPAGVAYHHAGLIADERRILEQVRGSYVACMSGSDSLIMHAQAFRTGAILVLCTTSTLSAGVNLPAHRVVIREPRMGGSDLSVAVFRQMAGRAGRLGYSAFGEAILHIKNNRSEPPELSYRHDFFYLF